MDNPARRAWFPEQPLESALVRYLVSAHASGVVLHYFEQQKKRCRVADICSKA